MSMTGHELEYPSGLHTYYRSFIHADRRPAMILTATFDD
jgi:hypothetical protein